MGVGITSGVASCAGEAASGEWLLASRVGDRAVGGAVRAATSVGATGGVDVVFSVVVITAASDGSASASPLLVWCVLGASSRMVASPSVSTSVALCSSSNIGKSSCVVMTDDCVADAGMLNVGLG